MSDTRDLSRYGHSLWRNEPFFGGKKGNQDHLIFDPFMGESKFSSNEHVWHSCSTLVKLWKQQQMSHRDMTNVSIYRRTVP